MQLPLQQSSTYLKDCIYSVALQNDFAIQNNSNEVTINFIKELYEKLKDLSHYNANDFKKILNSLSNFCISVAKLGLDCFDEIFELFTSINTVYTTSITLKELRNMHDKAIASKQKYKDQKIHQLELQKSIETIRKDIQDIIKKQNKDKKEKEAKILSLENELRELLKNQSINESYELQKLIDIKKDALDEVKEYNKKHKHRWKHKYDSKERICSNIGAFKQLFYKMKFNQLPIYQGEVDMISKYYKSDKIDNLYDKLLQNILSLQNRIH